MNNQALAIKYRPHTWDDVVEADSIKIILQQQLESGQIQHAYLFAGASGCGKTTCARIFANEINKGQGNPIEMDAASNSGVDDVRNIIQQAKSKSLDSEYKVFIIDEAHSISNTGWQAFLKLIEEPPAKSIFIFCTTDPQKIPKTILSRVQRYDFKRISQKGIVDRLQAIYAIECGNVLGGDDVYIHTSASDSSIEYIAKIAEGGMRSAISYLDKCLAYSTELTLENVIRALGTVDYDIMFDLTDYIISKKEKEAIQVIEDIHMDGKDLKLFVKQYMQFLLDIQKWLLKCPNEYIQIPLTEEYERRLQDIPFEPSMQLLSTIINLNSDIKWDAMPKVAIECAILMECEGE